MNACWRSSSLFFLIGAILFILFSFVLFGMTLGKEAHFEIDSTGYDRFAQEFVSTNLLTNPAEPYSMPVQPVGYHLFLGLIYTLFGINYKAVIVVQVLLSILSGFLMVVLSRQLFGETVAKIVALLFPLQLGFLIYAQFILAEIMLVTTLLLFWHRLFAFIASKRMVHGLQMALLLGLSVLIKPVAWFYIFIVLFIIWYFLPLRMITIGFLLLAFYLPVIGYMSYNYVRYDRFVFAPLFELNMYQCFLSKVISRVERKPVQQIIDEQLRFEGTNTLDRHGWDCARTLFFSYLKTDAHLFLIIWLENVSKTLFGLFTTQLKVLLNPAIKGGSCSFFAIDGSLIERCYGYIAYGALHWSVILLGVVHALLLILTYGLSFYALITVWSSQPIITLLFASFIIVSACMTGMDGCCRYRIVFEPLLFILTAYGIYYFFITNKNRLLYAKGD